jgi:hypothetical protein
VDFTVNFREAALNIRPPVKFVTQCRRIGHVRAQPKVGCLTVHTFGVEPSKSFVRTVLESGHIGVG